MSRRVIAGILSFLLTFTLLLPAAGAQEESLQQAESAVKVISGLDRNAVSLDDLKPDPRLSREQRQSQSARSSSQSLFHDEALKIEQQAPLPSSSLQPENYVPLTDSQEPVSVIVELQQTPVKVFEAEAGQVQSKSSLKGPSISSHLAKIKLEKSIFKKAAQSQLNAKIKREFTQVFNGYSLTLAANQVEELLTLPGVKAVYPNKTVYATSEPDTLVTAQGSVPFIGSEALWSEGARGEGIKIGVLDTGAAKDHPDLEGAIVRNPDGYWGYDIINNDGEPYETTKEDYYKAREENPNLPEVNELGKTYYTSHGSHVTGIIAGQGVGAAGMEGIKGVAPEADIYAYKVLGPYGGGTNEGVIAGIEKAVEDGMDVINLSLGSPGNNEASADSVAVNNAVRTGVIAIVAGGNDGPGEATVGDPGSAELAVTVGASKHPMETPIIKVGGSDDSAFFMETFDKSQGIETLTEEYELVDVGFGREADYAGKDLNGKIALIKRGELSFEEKARNTIASGAIGAIIFNNVPGELESGTLGEINVTIPIYALSGVAGERIKTELEANSALKVTFDTTVEQDIMGDFSSRGPSKPSFDIKPDITAPGVRVLSSVPEYEGWYAAQNGTSMAAPHIAGASALLKEKYPDLTPSEIKALMMNNTVKLNDRLGARYKHMEQGAGRISLEKILKAKAVAMAEETTANVGGKDSLTHYTGSISFGYVSLGSAGERKITVKDIAGQNSSYVLSTEWYGSSPVQLELSNGQVDVPAGGQGDFSIAVKVPEQTDATYYEGELKLADPGSGHEIQMPIALYIGETPENATVSDVTLEPDIFSPNGDTVSDVTNISFKLNQGVPYFSLDVHAADGQWLGMLLDGNDLNPGTYKLNEPWNGSGLNEGLYYLVPWVGDGRENAVPLEDQAAAFIIDTTAPLAKFGEPDIVVDKSSFSGTISGMITQDLLIDLLVSQGKLSIPDVIGVAVLYGSANDGKKVQIDGTVDKNGNFAVQVPVNPGENSYEIYIYDLAGNGQVVPAHVVNYKSEVKNAVVVTALPSQVPADQPFTVGVDFDVTAAVYSAKFDLVYSKQLTVPEVVPSPQLGEHQAKWNPDAQLSVTGAVYELSPESSRYEYSVALNGTPGYTGIGSLASFRFGAAPHGEYSFELVNLVLLDQNGQEIQADSRRQAKVTVLEKPALRVEPQTLSLQEGSKGKLTVIYRNAEGKETDVTAEAEYTPANPALISVDKGQVTGKRDGRTTVEINYGALRVTADITVTDAPGSGGSGGGSGKSSRNGSSSGTLTPPPVTPKLEQAPAGSVRVAVKDGEPTVVSLEGGLTVTVPAGALPGEAGFVQVTPATDEAAATLLAGLNPEAVLRPAGKYYDFAVLDKSGKVLSNPAFSQPVTVSIPVEALVAAKLNPEKISLFKLPEQGQPVQLPTLLKDGSLVARLSSFSRYMFMAKEMKFTDVTETNYSWAVNEIEVLAAKDIVTGRSGNLFGPQEQVTRAEFVSLLARALDLKPSGPAEVQFGDVPAGSWYYDAVQSVVKAGIVTGYDNRTFAPDQAITRAEMAIILSRALEHAEGKTAAPAASSFSDQKEIPSWAKEAAAKVAGLGLLQGKSGNRFEGEAFATRAEAAVVMYRLYRNL
ncbi:S8 family serine peptidase [Paenibacillus sp. A14]|uniref:S8 family serine peptidase n=1 Tax=Paenibacillus sp. A14 TaxID=3119820 RepID=UPI002FE37183